MSIQVPRESLELLGPIQVTATATDGDPVDTASLVLALIPNRQRPAPADWQAPRIVDGGQYLLIGPPDRPLDRGTYQLWGRLTSYPEVPVFEISPVTIT